MSFAKTLWKTGRQSERSNALVIFGVKAFALVEGAPSTSSMSARCQSIRLEPGWLGTDFLLGIDDMKPEVSFQQLRHQPVITLGRRVAPSEMVAFVGRQPALEAEAV